MKNLEKIDLIKKSTQLWLKHLQDKGYSTLFKLHPNNGPILVSWLSPWRKKHLIEAEEWCLDSAHKTCKSFVDSKQDCYLYTIMIRSPLLVTKVSLLVFSLQV